ncbi:MAG: hypothetical protein Q9164_006815, partial [Protoblastenia rupestris]
MAGLNMTGNFANFLALLNPFNISGERLGIQVANTTYVPDKIVLGGNTIAGNNYNISFQYLNDSEKQIQNPTPDPDYGYFGPQGMGFYLGVDRDSPELYWAVVWSTCFTTPLSAGGPTSTATEITSMAAVANSFNVPANGYGGPASGDEGKLYVIHMPFAWFYSYHLQEYSLSRGSMNIISTRIPRHSASIPFVIGITASILQYFAAIHDPPDFAARFAKSYNRTLISLPAGMILPLPAKNTSRRVETTVTRVPIAPFLSLIILNLL